MIGGEMGRAGLGEGRDGMYALFLLDDAARKLSVKKARARRLGRSLQKARACGRHRLPGEETGATGSFILFGLPSLRNCISLQPRGRHRLSGVRADATG